jgi:His/Glu/Gln/Arg/opine family amino acid ABC transporter permease subunit
MNLDFSRVWGSIPFILQGIPVTLQYTGLSVLFGFIWGVGLSLLKISEIKPLDYFAQIYTSLFRGVPLILILSLVYFATPQLTGFQITALQAGVITFSLNSGAYVSETIRAGILSVDKGQKEAAMSLGIPYLLYMWDIIMPQALKNILPALVNESINVLKDTALISTLGNVQDILRSAQIVGAEKYVYFEPLMIAGAIYYVLVMTLTFGASALEKWMRRID